MARVSFGGKSGGRPAPAPIRPVSRAAPARPKAKKWYEDPALILGWVRLAETLAAPKGLIARGVRAAQRWQLEQDADARREAVEVDQQLNMLRQRAEQGDIGAMGALDPMGESADRAQLMADYQGGMRPADPLFRTATDPGVKPGAEGQVLPRVAPAAEEAPSAPTQPLPEAGRFQRGSLEPLWEAEKGGASPKELLAGFGDTYVNALLTRLKHDDARDKAARHLGEIGMMPPQAGGAPTAPQPEPEKAPVGYRAARRAQDEAQAAKAKEVEDYAADMSLSTIEEVYNDFSKFVASHKGPLGPNDFADFYEQLKFVTDRDPSLVDGLALDPVGTKRQILRDAMAYFKFLNMGGDPAAAKKSAEEAELRGLRLNAARRKEEAELKAAERRKSFKRTRHPDLPDLDPVTDGIIQWDRERRNMSANVPSWARGAGTILELERKALSRALSSVEEAWGPKGGWSRSQKKIWKEEAKKIKSDVSKTRQDVGRDRPTEDIKKIRGKYNTAKANRAGTAKALREARARLAELEEEIPKQRARDRSPEYKAAKTAVARAKTADDKAQGVLNARTEELEEADPTYFGQNVDRETVDVPPGFTQRQ